MQHLYVCKFSSFIDIYGTDLKCLKDHLLFHFRHIHDITDNETTVRICYEPIIEDDYIIRIIKEIGIAECSINPKCLGKQIHFVFERDV